MERYEQSVLGRIEDFRDPRHEWRRLFSGVLGTFFLVLVAAGGGMMSQAFPDTISRQAAVVAPGAMVLAIILFMGKVSGAHLNPSVSMAFAPAARLPLAARPRLHRRPTRRTTLASSRPSWTSPPSTGAATRRRGSDADLDLARLFLVERTVESKQS